jgi:nitrate reductase gamma subunit
MKKSKNTRLEKGSRNLVIERPRAGCLRAWVFHAMLVLILIGHVRVAMDFPRLWAALGINADSMSAWIGGAAGIVIMLTVIFLLLRRMTLERVREITQGGDWFALVLVLLIILSGNAMRFLEHFDLKLTRAYFASPRSHQLIL